MTFFSNLTNAGAGAGCAWEEGGCEFGELRRAAGRPLRHLEPVQPAFPPSPKPAPARMPRASVSFFVRPCRAGNCARHCRCGSAPFLLPRQSTPRRSGLSANGNANSGRRWCLPIEWLPCFPPSRGSFCGKMSFARPRTAGVPTMDRLCHKKIRQNKPLPERRFPSPP